MIGVGIGLNKNKTILPQKPFGQTLWQNIVKQWQVITDNWNS